MLLHDACDFQRYAVADGDCRYFYLGSALNDGAWHAYALSSPTESGDGLFWRALGRAFVALANEGTETAQFFRQHGGIR